MPRNEHKYRRFPLVSICEDGCGEWVFAWHTARKRICAECQRQRINEAARERRRKNKIIRQPIKCDGCGTTIPVPYNNQTFCTPKCWRKHNCNDRERFYSNLTPSVYGYMNLLWKDTTQTIRGSVGRHLRAVYLRWIWEEQGGVDNITGKPLTLENATIDHIWEWHDIERWSKENPDLPLSDFHKRWNLQVVSRSTNSKKSHKVLPRTFGKLSNH